MRWRCIKIGVAYRARWAAAVFRPWTRAILDANEVTVVAIIVTYEPEPDALKGLLDSVISQVDAVVVIDNGSKVEVALWISEWAGEAVSYVPLYRNLGIAAAQNAGIKWAKERGAQYVVLFDQDSRPSPDMVKRLLDASTAKARQGVLVAAVGPRYLDGRQNNPPPFIRIRGLRLRRLNCDHEDIVAVDYLISSGSLMSMATLDAVGGMAESFFIDYVDIEWGLRAKQHGFGSFGVCSATMGHTLGENPIPFFGRRIPVHSPLRHYYPFRHAVYMYRWMQFPRNWKAVDGWRLVFRFFFYVLVTKPRYQHLSYMAKGIFDGLRGRMGSLET